MGDIQKNVNGKWEKPINLSHYIRFVNFKDVKLPVLSLEYEAEAYEKLQRFEEAEKIRKFIKNKKCPKKRALKPAFSYNYSDRKENNLLQLLQCRVLKVEGLD